MDEWAFINGSLFSTFYPQIIEKHGLGWTKTRLALFNMNNMLVIDNGKVRNIEDIQLVEDIIDLKNKKDKWAVIDKLVKIWSQKAPDEEKMIQINIAQYKETLKDKKFGQTLLGKDQERRFKLSFPTSLMMYIRKVYTHEELPIDEKFFDEFGKRFPMFKVASH